MSQGNRGRTKDRLSLTTAYLVGFGAVALATAVCWCSLKWERLADRVDDAESRLSVARKEVAAHRQRAEELREVEASLRGQMKELSRFLELQHDADEGLGVSRGTVAAAFDDLELINKDDSAGRESEHYAVENLAGSIQLRGPPNDLKQIEFFGELKGPQSENSAAMLVALLKVVAPQWESADRSSWLANLMNIDDDMIVCKEIDRARVNRRWRDHTAFGSSFTGQSHPWRGPTWDS